MSVCKSMISCESRSSAILILSRFPIILLHRPSEDQTSPRPKDIICGSSFFCAQEALWRSGPSSLLVSCFFTLEVYTVSYLVWPSANSVVSKTIVTTCFLPSCLASFCNLPNRSWNGDTSATPLLLFRQFKQTPFFLLMFFSIFSDVRLSKWHIQFASHLGDMAPYCLLHFFCSL